MSKLLKIVGAGATLAVGWLLFTRKAKAKDVKKGKDAVKAAKDGAEAGDIVDATKDEAKPEVAAAAAAAALQRKGSAAEANKQAKAMSKAERLEYRTQANRLVVQIMSGVVPADPAASLELLMLAMAGANADGQRVMSTQYAKAIARLLPMIPRR